MRVGWKLMRSKDTAHKAVVSHILWMHKQPEPKDKVIHVYQLRKISGRTDKWGWWWDSPDFHEGVKASLAARDVTFVYMYVLEYPFYCVDPLPEIEQAAIWFRTDAQRKEWERVASRAIDPLAKRQAEALAESTSAILKLIPIEILDSRNSYYEEARKMAHWYATV